MIQNKLFTRLTMTILMALMFVLIARSSSHREAPLISNDPLADNVDLYAFKSPDNPDMITILATYVPFQLPHGGPNYYTFGENVRYEIHVDNDPAIPGDEVTYRFTFNIINEDPSTFFYIRLGKQNQKATFNLERSLDGGETFEMIVENGIVPPNNIGPRSIESGAGLDSDYETLWNNAITTASTGERVFAGPSDDPFFVDLGGIFDLGDAPRQNGTPSDGVACFNVSTLAIQVPISTLLKTGAAATPTSILDADYVIGVWASASRPAVTTLSKEANPTYDGDWIQVSRLGMPLTNEAVIPIGQKDFWNSITPYDEITETTMDQYFFNPELALYMDDDQFGGAVPAFGPLRIQTNSLGAFDFTNGGDGLFSLKGSDAVAGTALDDAVFGTLLLPGAGMPRSVDLWPAFHTGVPNVIPYQLATGKEGNPLAAGKPFVNNFLPNGGDMLRLNMAVPVTSRDDTNFSSLGLIQAAAIGLTVAPFNTTADLEFIPNMDGFPNGRRLEDDVTRIELQAVGGAVLAAVGLWYDDYDPATSESPVTQDLLNVLGYTTGVEANDVAFRNTFPYVATPHSGTGDCSGSKIQNEDMATEEVDRFYTSSNTTPEIGVYSIQNDGSIIMSSIPSEAADADGIYYDKENDVLYQLNRSANVINAYSDVSGTPTLTATSTSDFINGREIAVVGSKLVVTQDANDDNDGNAFYIYSISPTAITLDKKLSTDINLWGITADGSTLIAIVDNSNEVATFENFFSNQAGMVSPTNTVSVEGLVRTHGVTYDQESETLFLTDIGDAASATDGAFIIVADWASAAADGTISTEEQVRVGGDNSSLGNPVDIAFDATASTIYIAERASEGGKVLGFSMPTESGDQTAFYSKLADGVSAIHFAQEAQELPLMEVDRFYASSNTQAVIGVYGLQNDGSIIMSSIPSEAADADGIYYDKENDVLYQLNRTDNVINAYSNVSTTPTLTATSSSDFINGREIAVKGDQLVVAQDANDDNGGNAFYIYNISPSSITLDKKLDTEINLWGIHANGNTLIAIIDNSNSVATFDDFFNQPEGAIVPTSVVTVEGLVRTHGVTFDADEGTLVLTDIGDAASATDGAIVIVKNWNEAASDMNIEVAEQIRIEGDATFLGNPVDIAINPNTKDIFAAERANEGGRILGFTMPMSSGDQVPFYNELFAGVSAIYFSQDPPIDCNVSGGMLTLADGNSSITICADGTPDPFEVSLTGNSGENSAWIITDADGNILGLPNGPIFDLDGAGVGECQLYSISYDGTAGLQDVGGNISALTGCFELSNPITVVRLVGDDCGALSTTYTTTLTGTQEVIPALTMATGSIEATLVGNDLSISGSFSGLSSDFDAAIAGGSHIHDAPIGRGGGIVVTLVPELSADLRSGSYDATDNTFTLTDEQVASFLNRDFYVNIHTTAYPGGELRGQLLPSNMGVYQTNLTGSNQTPGVVSSATGGLLVEVNGNTITVSGSFTGLSSEIATDIAGGAHIHHAPAGRNGEVVRVLDLTIDDDSLGAVIDPSKNSFELTDEELGWLNFNALYINVHSLTNMGGEIRGQLVPLSIASFRARLVGNQQTPAINTAADGAIIVNYDADGEITVSGSFNNLEGALATDIVGGAHLHLNAAGLAGEVIIPIVSQADASGQNGIFFPANNGYTLDASQSSELFDRGIYVNVHSETYRSGEIRGQLLPISQANFATNLSGLNEVDANPTSAMGNLQLEWNAGKLVVTGGFQGLTGAFDANVAGGSHIHLGEAGQNGGISITLVPTLNNDNLGGEFEAANNTFDITEDQMAALAAGGTYVNIHTTTYASGELRGQILGDDNSFPTQSAITAPAAGATVNIDGLANSNFTVTWNGVSDPNGDKVVYVWQLFTDADASTLLFQSNTGTSTNFTTTQDVVDELLATAGIADGASVTLYHRVISSDGSLNTPSDLVSVNLVKGAEEVLEGCHTPQNIKVSPRGNGRFSVSWSKVDEAIGYEILIGLEGAPRSFATVPVRSRKIYIASRSGRAVVFQVRAVCADGVKSDYSAPITYAGNKSKSYRKSDDLSPIEVSETASLEDVSVYPNPTNGDLTIAYTTGNANVNLLMYDVQGRIVKQAKLESQIVEHKLDVSDMIEGIYLMTITENGIQVMSERIIKTK